MGINITIKKLKNKTKTNKQTNKQKRTPVLNGHDTATKNRI